MEFRYDGGAPGSGANVTLHDGDELIGSGRLERTTAYYFSFDETLNIGVDRGTPVSDDYEPLDNAFTGVIDWVKIELVGAPTEFTQQQRQQQLLAHQ